MKLSLLSKLVFFFFNFLKTFFSFNAQIKDQKKWFDYFFNIFYVSLNPVYYFHFFPPIITSLSLRLFKIDQDDKKHTQVSNFIYLQIKDLNYRLTFISHVRIFFFYINNPLLSSIKIFFLMHCLCKDDWLSLNNLEICFADATESRLFINWHLFHMGKGPKNNSKKGFCQKM